jgi:hypothetical protein
MKHLKRFNEELSPRVYQTAGIKLNQKARKSGNQEFKTRGNALQEYGDMKRWKQNLEEYSKFGKTPITIQYNEEGDTETGDFYLTFDFDVVSFEDSVQEYLDDDLLHLQFAVGLIPVDEETKDKFMSLVPDNHFSNGFFWGFWVGFEFEDKNTGKGLELKESSISSYDWNVTGKLTFNRSLCGAIRRYLNTFFTESSDYPSSSDKSMYKLIEQEVIIAGGVSQKFGTTMSDLCDMVKSISANDIMAAVDDRQSW